MTRATEERGSGSLRKYADPFRPARIREWTTTDSEHTRLVFLRNTQFRDPRNRSVSHSFSCFPKSLHWSASRSTQTLKELIEPCCSWDRSTGIGQLATGMLATP